MLGERRADVDAEHLHEPGEHAPATAYPARVSAHSWKGVPSKARKGSALVNAGLNGRTLSCVASPARLRSLSSAAFTVLAPNPSSTSCFTVR